MSSNTQISADPFQQTVKIARIGFLSAVSTAPGCSGVPQVGAASENGPC